MPSPRKPWWQQATALVSLGTGGAITGFAFAHGTTAHLASPASVPVTLTALDQAVQPPTAEATAHDSVVRAAIVKVASYYARLAETKTPAEMEALIWQQDSTDGTNHGQSCAAFASMTLHLGAQLVGKQSWVTGGSTYPWPLHSWVDARVDANADSLNITSVRQDAEAHDRWHALGDGYEPLPGDWVLFDQHVEVVTGYSGGVLSTIGGDSLPNFSVNSHEYSGSLSSHGVEGFVSNGDLPAVTTDVTKSTGSGSATGSGFGSGSATESGTRSAAGPGSTSASTARSGKAVTAPQKPAAASQQADRQSEDALAAIPGTSAQTTSAGSSQAAPSGTGRQAAASSSASASASIPGMPSGSGRPTQAASGSAQPEQAEPARQPQAKPSASIPGVPSATPSKPTPAKPAAKASDPTPAPAPAPVSQPKPAAAASPSYQRHQVSAPSAGTTPGTAAQRAFIDAIAPGALAAQRTYGVPAAVTIAQAIDESNWGQSTLASDDHNLFGIKGNGPAGTVALPTHEVYNGETVSITAQFRVYHDLGQSIDDHGKLLADSAAYTTAMASRNSPNSFANALTGVYATDPSYGTSLISLMRQYNLYRYDASAASNSAPSVSAPAAPASPKSQPHGATQSHPASQPQAAPQPRASASRRQASPSPAPKATSPRLAAPSARASSSAPPSTQPSATASPAPAAASTSPAPSSPAPSSGPGAAPSMPTSRQATVPHPFATPSGSGAAKPSSGTTESPATAPAARARTPAARRRAAKARAVAGPAPARRSAVQPGPAALRRLLVARSATPRSRASPPPRRPLRLPPPLPTRRPLRRRPPLPPRTGPAPRVTPRTRRRPRPRRPRRARRPSPALPP